VSENGKSENNFEPMQWEVLKQLLVILRRNYPEAEIKGHRDYPRVYKDCPCFDVGAWLAKEGLV
jgi:N-acetylmuramoyl-L-alanine amidase